MSILSRGLSVDVILERDYLKNNFRAFRTVIYSESDQKILLSQTSPPLMKSHLGQTVIITYCTTNNAQTQRYGFSAKISDLINDYEIDSSTRGAAIVLERNSQPEQMNIRLHFRIRPTVESVLSILYWDSSLNILDISMGGALLSSHTIRPLKPETTIPLKLKIDQRVFDLEARVIRVWSSRFLDMAKETQFIAVRFLPGSRDMEHCLSNKIIALQRELLAKGKIRR